MNELAETTKTDLEKVEFLRIRCSICTKETAMTGTRADFKILLEHFGWRLSGQPLCLECIKKQARKAFEKFR